MSKYRKKPVVIEAVKWRGDNWPEVFDFLHDEKGNIQSYARRPSEDLKIKTLEGTMVAEIGDWIIKGVKGEFYPCKPDIFEQTYEKVEDSPLACNEEYE